MTFLTDDTVGRLRDVAARPSLPPGRYTLGAPLGRGGMGTVYAARDELFGRDVAIKVSHAARPDSGLEARLRREAGVLATLEHPGIVPVHDSGTLEDGRRFYVMKLVRGETLAEHAARLTSEAAILTVVERIVDTVAFAHAARVVHRDLKPSNVMVGRFGEVLVLDWGVAKVVGQPPVVDTPPDHASVDTTGLEAVPADATHADTRIGTPGYMSPEQADGRSARAGPAADVYSLGALIFWLLTRQIPPGPVEAATARLRAVAPAVPKRLRAIVLRCLAPDPDRRYPDAAALADDLARYRAGQPVMAHRETWLDRLVHWLATYRTAILLVLAYLVMRTLFAFATR
ncbi:MAG TPA: serine/threonine-protein kinase [Vicinamibacterales bacterium]|nr:serine/threonine-protein kinase [Vicinamibacterales bacterium]